MRQAKKCTIRIRMTQAQKEQLRSEADDAGVTLSDLIRTRVEAKTSQTGSVEIRNVKRLLQAQATAMVCEVLRLVRTQNRPGPGLQEVSKRLDAILLRLEQAQ
jgi:hypothetical protein